MKMESLRCYEWLGLIMPFQSVHDVIIRSVLWQKRVGFATHSTKEHGHLLIRGHLVCLEVNADTLHILGYPLN